MFARDVVYVPDAKVDFVTYNQVIGGIATPDRLKHGLVQVSDKKSTSGLDGERFNGNLGLNGLVLRSLALLIEAHSGLRLSVSEIMRSMATNELEIAVDRELVQDICPLINSSVVRLVRQDVYVNFQSEFSTRFYKRTFKLSVFTEKTDGSPDLGSRLIGNGQNILRHYKSTDLVTCDEEE